MTRLLRCAKCGAVVDPSDYPEWDHLGAHKDPIPNGCGGLLVSVPAWLHQGSLGG